ncbi:uncharacterized protein LOC110774003 [Prunus avium]|uniref:Uncharacterized protein LOC110774003 n=1 Tax=Prunus avium TaxID=42229 RepID=A0A6P5U273_PRUAV|nr:uncharacterized protein LOC110774003 [Prunus avium]
MGFMLCAFLILILLLLLLHSPSSSALISSFSSSSSSHEIQHKPPSDASTATAAQYRVFYIKNTTPFPLDKQDQLSKKHRKMRHKQKKRRKKTNNNFKSRPFSVMLPKGFVPPSGSSPCHNGYPNSVVFFCDLAPTTAKP